MQETLHLRMNNNKYKLHFDPRIEFWGSELDVGSALKLAVLFDFEKAPVNTAFT